jgi:CheY-like chemotaxis protein
MIRLLVVEDDADQLEIRSLLLEHAGYEVVRAASVDQALQRLAPAPDAAIIDLSLPRPEDGRFLLREIRSRAPEVPLVVLTGLAEALHGQPEKPLVTAILQKPSPTRNLLDTIARIVGANLFAGALLHCLEVMGLG